MFSLTSRSAKTWRRTLNAIGNVVQPTRNLYHLRFKSYGPLCDFHKSGDLDLELYPIFKKFKMPGSYELHTSVAKRIRTIGPVLWPVHPSKTDKHTDRQDRQTAVTNILCKNLRFCKVITRLFDRPQMCRPKSVYIG